MFGTTDTVWLLELSLSTGINARSHALCQEEWLLQVKKRRHLGTKFIRCALHLTVDITVKIKFKKTNSSVCFSAT